MKKAENIVMDHSSRFSEEKRFELSKELFEILGSILNEVHDFNYSSRFWAMMLQDHVRAVITRRDKLIDVESERKPDIFPINGPNYPSFKIKSKNYLIEFIKHLQTRFKKKSVVGIVK